VQSHDPPHAIAGRRQTLTSTLHTYIDSENGWLAVVLVFEDDSEAYLPSASAEFGNEVFDKQAREAVRVHFLRGAINRLQTDTAITGRITREIALFGSRVSRLCSRFLGVNLIYKTFFAFPGGLAPAIVDRAISTLMAGATGSTLVADAVCCRARIGSDFIGITLDITLFESHVSHHHSHFLSINLTAISLRQVPLSTFP
jgi:hypothetical protein